MSVNPGSSVKDVLQFMTMRRRGVSPDAALQELQVHQQKVIDKKAHELSQTILQRQKEAETVLRGLVQSIEELDPLQAVRQHLEKHKQTVQELSKKEGELEKGLDEGTSRFRQQKHEKEKLISRLNTLRALLDSAPSSTQEYQDFFNLCGGKALSPVPIDSWSNEGGA